MYLNTPDGEKVWSSRPEFSRTERRALSWRFYEGSSGRSTLWAWSLCFGLVVMLVVAGLTDWTVAIFVPVVIALVNVGIISGIGDFIKDDRQRMYEDHQLRFTQMQSGAPGFDLASCYLDLLHGRRTDADAIIAKWLESRWLDDHFSVLPDIHVDAIDHAQFRLGATERAVDSFGRLDLPQLPMFEEFCASELDKARRALKKEIKAELKKERHTVDEVRERIDKLEGELARVDRRIAVEQGDTR